MATHQLTRRDFLTAAAAGLGAVVLAACAQTASPTSPAASAAASSAVKAAGSGSGASTEWQQQWDSWIAGAKKEGKLVLATGPSPEARVKVPEAFKKAFGVDLEYLGGSSSELANRIRSEQGAGQYTLDVSISGANTSYITFHGEKMIEPVKPHLIHPDVLNPAMWASGKGVWYMDPSNEYFVRIANIASPQVLVNIDFLKPDGLKSWNDLLKPEYKGKIIALDPTQPGSGGQTGAYLYKVLGADWAKRFYIDQEPGLTLDDRQQADALARGKYPIALGLRVEETVRLQKEGFKLSIVSPWSEAPGYLSAAFGILGLFKNPPHPNAAKLFLNWILMKDGQIAWNSAWKTASVRTDVDNSWVPEFIVPKPGIKYFDAYDWDYSSTGWKEINDALKKMLADRPKG